MKPASTIAGDTFAKESLKLDSPDGTFKQRQSQSIPRAYQEIFRRFRPSDTVGRRRALGQLGLADDAEIALDQALAISPTNFDFDVRTRPPWFSPEKHAHLVEGLRKEGPGKRSSTRTAC